ncbi:MAG: hypothetical protein QOJ66_2177 [Ilumatobacteraceae bacterium]
MKKSLIWITAGVAGIGFGIPAFAEMSSQNDRPVTTTTPTVVSTPEPRAGDDSVTSLPSTPAVISIPVVTAATIAPLVTTANSIEDTSGSCSEPGDAADDRCTGIDDDSHASTDATVNSVADVSGPCDEAEHATDDRCTGVDTSTGAGTVTSIDVDSGHDTSGHGGSDDMNHSGRGGSNDG